MRVGESFKYANASLYGDLTRMQLENCTYLKVARADNSATPIIYIYYSLARTVALQPSRKGFSCHPIFSSSCIYNRLISIDAAESHKYLPTRNLHFHSYGAARRKVNFNLNERLFLIFPPDFIAIVARLVTGITIYLSVTLYRFSIML